MVVPSAIKIDPLSSGIWFFYPEKYWGQCLRQVTSYGFSPKSSGDRTVSDTSCNFR
jgi:hypothetical protein